MKRKHNLTRRELIQKFGILGFLLHPLVRSMAYASAPAGANPPRFVMIMKGGGYQPGQLAGISTPLNMAGTPLAPLQPSGADLILFKNMHITGGSTYGGNEEHGCGLIGCVTGDITKYQSGHSDSYFAYTDNESIDTRIAREYATNPATKTLIDQLVIGGSYSDSDETGLGQKYFSFKQRRTGQTGYYDNANPPTEDPALLYDALMRKISTICVALSNQPLRAGQSFRAAVNREKAIIGFQIQDINDAKAYLGMDSEHSHKLDGMLEGWSALDQSMAKLQAAGVADLPACPKLSRPVGAMGSKLSSLYRSGNLDKIGLYHDYFIQLIQLAFQWDLTRVVAFSLGAPSNGQSYPSQKVNSAHHNLEHSGDDASLAKIDRYYSEKIQMLLTSLSSVRDPDNNSMLYNSTIVQVSECWSNPKNSINGDGDHSLKQVPFLLAGQGGGHFTTGQVVDARSRSINDLWLSCLAASGVSATSFGAARFCKGPIV